MTIAPSSEPATLPPTQAENEAHVATEIEIAASPAKRPHSSDEESTPKGLVPRPRRMLFRQYFLDGEKSNKYIGVGIYPDHEYRCLIELGLIRGKYMLFDAASFGDVLELMLCGNGVRGKCDREVKLVKRKNHSALSYRNISFSLTADEILKVIFLHLCITRQQAKFNASYEELKSYIDNVSITRQFVTPVSNNFDYELLFDELTCFVL